MNAPTDPKQFRVQLKDAKLFHEQCYIDGDWADADGKQTIPVTNPATGGVIGSIPKMGAAETRRAIEAADRALPAWRAKIAKERPAILRKWFELMLANQDDLGLIMTTEQGKPLAEAKGEIAYAASFIEWFAEEGKRVYGDVIPTVWPDRRLVVIKQPVGVCGAITPWNFPAAMITRKVGPALAAGCTIVVKPATQTPFSALAHGRAGGARRRAEGRVQRRHRLGQGDRRRAHRQPDRAQDHLHRLHRSRPRADGAERADHQEGVAGAGRQRALPGVRRRRPRCGGGGRDDLQVPQRRADLRVRQPHPGAGQGLRRVRREARRQGQGAQGRARAPRPASTSAR